MVKNIIFSSTTNMLLMNNEKILVIKRSDSLKDFPGWYMLPGGKQEEHETPEEAAIRETREETGLEVRNAQLRVVATHFHEYKNKVYLVYIFVSSSFEGELNGSIEGVPQWVDINKMLQDPQLYPDLKRHIRLIMERESGVMFTYHRFNENIEIVEAR